MEEEARGGRGGRGNNIQDLDNEAAAFQSVLGFMLARIYNNPQSKDDNQSRLEKILQIGRASCRERVCQYV